MQSTMLLLSHFKKLSGFGCKEYCVVPENIHTPTTEGIGNSRGVGGSKSQEIQEGRGVDSKINFQMVQFNSVPT